MIAPRLLRKFGIYVSLIAALGLSAFAGSASAQAKPDTCPDFAPSVPAGCFYHQDTFTDAVHDGCTGLDGTITAARTEWGYFVSKDGSAHVTFTASVAYRIDWSDGTYSIGEDTEHVDFDTNGLEQVERTFTHRNQVTLYSADGRVIGTQTYLDGFHFTYTAANGISFEFTARVVCF